MKHGPSEKTAKIKLAAPQRAALARLARGENRISWRARGVLLLADGRSKASVARELGVGVAAVRDWERRWMRGGGVESLALRCRGRSGRRERQGSEALESFPTRLPAIEKRLLRVADGRGRPAGARVAVEAWLRDAAALGIARPGSPVPSERRLAALFRASSNTVAAAMGTLSREGFIVRKARLGSFFARRPPFAGRYLLYLAKAPDNTPEQGLSRALQDVARMRSQTRGENWDVADGPPETPRERLQFTRRLAGHRWSGVFFRTIDRGSPLIEELLTLDRIPMSGFIDAEANTGKLVKSLAWQDFKAPEAAFGAVRAAGRRRALVIDGLYEYWTESREAAIRGIAARCGVEIPRDCFLILDPRTPEPARLALAAAVRAAREERIDSVAILQDNFAAPTCEIVAERFGAAEAARLALVAIGNAPTLPATCLPVTWHGLDMESTLASFVDWCNAIHAGEKSPPPPELATF